MKAVKVQVHVPVRDGNGKIILNGKGKPAQYSQEWVWRNTWGATKEKAEDIPGLVAHQTVNMHDDAIGVASSMENTAFATKNPEKTLVNDLEALKPNLHIRKTLIPQCQSLRFRRFSLISIVW